MKTKLAKLIYSAIGYLRTRKLDDEYINWLTFANAGMLNKGNVYAMNHAIKNLPSNNPIVEIGSFCGLSVNTINYLLSKNGKENQIVNCDKWIFEGAESDGNVANSHITHKRYREFVKSSFIKNIEFFSENNKPFTIEVFSDEFFKLWNSCALVKDIFNRDIQLGGSVSFCYIDGNHTYDYAKRDFQNIDQHLDVGGFILFDDSSDDNPFGLTRLMKEISNNKNYQLVMKNPNYLFKKV